MNLILAWPMPVGQIGDDSHADFGLGVRMKTLFDAGLAALPIPILARRMLLLRGCRLCSIVLDAGSFGDRRRLFGAAQGVVGSFGMRLVCSVAWVPLFDAGRTALAGHSLVAAQMKRG